MEKSIIIIGAGIAGLSAGCYAQMNGYNTHIFEMDTKPGGVCTAWKRKGYTIDGCIHWLVGSGPASNFYHIWEELGIIKNHTFIDHDEYLRIIGKEGKYFALYSDPDRLEKHMKELAPEDSGVIEDFIKGIRKGIGFDMPSDKAPELYNPFDVVKMLFQMLPYMGYMRKWSKLSAGEFASRFKNSFMREALLAIAEDVPDLPMLALVMPMAWVYQKTAGYPLGGSLEFSRTIEKRYLDLGGEVSYKSPVAKVMVENDRAVGIRLADGTEHHGDIIISAADGHTTIFDMLEGKYINDKIQGYYDNLALFPPLVFVAFGVNRTFDELPHSVSGFNLPLDEPITIAGKELSRLTLHVYNFDSSLAPEGKTVIRVMISTVFDYWDELYKDPERYKAEKERIADQVIAQLSKHFPGLAEQVEMRDVATPVTWVRYTGNWRGSYEGWMMGAESFRMRMSKTLPGLENFYMVGQWVEPGGGLPPAAMSGRNVTQIICKKDKKPFITTRP
ncbi:MAG TPA: NAD(P)/FAD-dependent oxidoreductase [Dehalococcoidia bacterium]|nr:NAD(P)/FAD-dependent oxidoreductase [Dehalococcoidia bacterium]